MSNLKAAIKALQDELAHAKQGATYYQAQVAALEEALTKLGGFDGNMPQTDIAPVISAPQRAKRTKRGATRSNGSSNKKLPSTGKDFWPSLITDEPRTAPEILEAAIRKLGFQPDQEQRKKLQLRQIAALNNLVKTNRVQDVGTRRERRYFIAK